MRLLIIAAILLAWEFVPRLFAIPLVLFPPLSVTLREGAVQWDTFLEHFMTTTTEAALAVLIACGLGLAIGLMIGLSQKLARAVTPLASTVYAIPIVVLYPLFTVWLGIGATSKIAFGAFYGFIPTLLTTVAGVSTIPSYYRSVASSLAASPFQRITLILLPAAIPSILSGLRLGGALAIVGVIAAEMLTSTAGLGFLISQFRTSLNTPGVYFSVICVIVLVVIFEILMFTLDLLCRRRWTPWKEEESGHTAGTEELIAA
jgi:NitT/TauT family transport system permease protein/taurine transport system permease protein